MADALDFSASAEQLQPLLQAAVSEFIGELATIDKLRQLTAGAAAQTWRFIAHGKAGERTLILRRGVDADQFAGALGKADEARVIAAAVAGGVSAPEVIGVLTESHGLGEGFVMSCIDGETLPPKILKDPRYEDARSKLAQHCGESLAQIHAVPRDQVSHLAVSGLGGQLDFYEQSYRKFDYPLPVFDAAFQLLRRKVTDYELDDPALTLVHGDFRNGNLIVGEEGLRAVLDWELAHIGDPMEDLGWLCVNSWRFGKRGKPVGGFGDRQSLFDAYQVASGKPVDPNRVAVWELFGVLKWGVICLYQCHVHLEGLLPSVERASIGRRVSECELDIVDLIETGGELWR